MKKVLIISHTFPPNNGIGGRRWAKFAKELSRRDYDLKVITFNNFNTGSLSNWEKDIMPYKDKIIPLKSRYPKWLEKNSKTIVDKIMYRMSLLYVKTFTKGNYYDRASFSRRQLINELIKNIRLGYNNIIVTCAPFKLALWISELIPTYPNVNFIVDFRDPWINNHTAYGLTSMSNKRQQFEQNAENKVLQRFQKVIVVANDMKSHLDANYPDMRHKIYVINNGFDEDDFKNLDNSPTNYFKENGRIKIVFTGTFYIKSLYLLRNLVDILEQNQDLSNKFEFHFFGNIPNEVTNYMNRLPDVFKYYPPIRLSEVYAVIKQSDYCSLFLTDDINYSFSTKFLEYLSQKKKILVFSNGGSTGGFVERNKIGYSITANNMSEKLLYILNEDPNLQYTPHFINEFNITELVMKIEDLLIN